MLVSLFFSLSGGQNATLIKAILARILSGQMSHIFILRNQIVFVWIVNSLWI